MPKYVYVNHTGKTLLPSPQDLSYLIVQGNILNYCLTEPVNL